MKPKQVENLHIPRCLQPPGFGRIKDISIHHFFGALEHEYVQFSYIRYINEDGLIHCSLLLGKSRVSLKKFISIPRLELTAAIFVYSQVVLAYIRNNSKRFKVFLLIISIRLKKIQRLISGTMSQANKILLMMLHEGLIQERKHLIVVDFMGHLSYGKWKHFGQTKIAA